MLIMLYLNQSEDTTDQKSGEDIEVIFEVYLHLHKVILRVGLALHRAVYQLLLWRALSHTAGIILSEEWLLSIPENFHLSIVTIKVFSSLLLWKLKVDLLVGLLGCHLYGGRLF